MILAIDIGNTNIVLGCADSDRILFRERLATVQRETSLEYAVKIKAALDINGIDRTQISGAVISSVVPSVTNTVKAAAEKLIDGKIMIVGPGIKTGLKIQIDNPAQLGSDLVVDARCRYPRLPLPQIIIDMGTATTFSVIDKDRTYIGGLITTGVAVSADALNSRTAQLPKIAYEKPKRVICSNTVDCITSGIMYSNACAIDGIIERIEEELGEKATVIATGGLSQVVIPLCRHEITYDDDLLLKGLMLIWNKNSK